MAKLIRNVYLGADLGWWGPDHGRTQPPPEVAALVTNPANWDVPPIVDPEAPVRSKDWVQGYAAALADVAALASAGEPPAPAGTTGDDQTPPGDPAGGWPLPPAEDPRVAELAALPDDKGLLLEYADRHKLDVNRQLNAKNLRGTLAARLGGAT